MRAAFGLVVFVWTLALLHDAFDFLSEDGLLPEQPKGHLAGDSFGPLSSDLALAILLAGLLVASAWLALGWHTRLSAMVVFIGLMSVERRNPFVFNSGDGLLRVRRSTSPWHRLGCPSHSTG